MVTRAFGALICVSEWEDWLVIIGDMVHGRRRSMISNATNCIASACDSVFSQVYVDWKNVSHANKTARVYHNQENFPAGLPFYTRKTHP